MQSYRFDGLVQGRLLQLQLAFFILVKVIPSLRGTHFTGFCEHLLQSLYCTKMVKNNCHEQPMLSITEICLATHIKPQPPT